jgi:hypothetical protein
MNRGDVWKVKTLAHSDLKNMEMRSYVCFKCIFPAIAKYSNMIVVQWLVVKSQV